MLCAYAERSAEPRGGARDNSLFDMRYRRADMKGRGKETLNKVCRHARVRKGARADGRQRLFRHARRAGAALWHTPRHRAENAAAAAPGWLGFREYAQTCLIRLRFARARVLLRFVALSPFYAVEHTYKENGIRTERKREARHRRHAARARSPCYEQRCVMRVFVIYIIEIVFVLFLHMMFYRTKRYR